MIACQHDQTRFLWKEKKTLGIIKNKLFTQLVQNCQIANFICLKNLLSLKSFFLITKNYIIWIISVRWSFNTLSLFYFKMLQVFVSEGWGYTSGLRDRKKMFHELWMQNEFVILFKCFGFLLRFYKKLYKF